MYLPTNVDIPAIETPYQRTTQVRIPDMDESLAYSVMERKAFSQKKTEQACNYLYAVRVIVVAGLLRTTITLGLHAQP